MLNSVLVPLDGSKSAEIALPYLYKLGNRFDISVTFLSVCQTEHSMGMCEYYINHIAETAQKNLGAKISAVAMTGNAATNILELAEKQKSELILMAAHGTAGLPGSVVHKVLTATNIPVMVVKEELKNRDEGWPQKAAVPLDGSKLSEFVLPHVIALARKGVKITTIRVCEPPTLLADYPEAIMPDGWEAHVRLAEKGAEKACNVYLEDVGDKLYKEGILAENKVVLAKSAAAGIMEYLEKDTDALLVMSTHGRSGFSLWPYGHVADRILLATKNPALLIRPNRRESDTRQ